MANPLLGNKKVSSYVQSQTRTKLMISSGFYMWNLPYDALLQFLPQQPGRWPPHDVRSTPSDIEITSPTPSAMPSPVFHHAVTLNASRNRTKLFVSVKFDDLLESLDRGEKK
jgi:hypothetical protein